MIRSLIWAVGFALCCLVDQAGGAVLSSQVEWVLPEGVEKPVDAEVRLFRSVQLADEGGAPPPSKTFNVTVPGRLSLEIPEGEIWRVEAKAAGYWCPEALLAAGGEVTVALRPAGLLRASLSLPQHAEAPTTMDVQVTGVRGRGQEAVRIECPTESRQVVCQIPAGTGLDLRLRARGFVSHYLWNQAVVMGEDFDLGTLTLRRGGSLVGWVEAEGAPLSAEALVHLTPQGGDGAASPVPQEKERSTGNFTAKPTSRGFFALEGLSPGSYRLRAEQPGLSAPEVPAIQVYQDSETRLDRPVVMSPPIVLEVFLDPPQDAFGENWGVELGRHGMAGRMESVPLSRAEAEAGQWSEEGLSAGRYSLLVIDSQGSAFGEETFDLAVDSGPLSIQLDLVAVEGTLRLGDEPLWAAITFRWPEGGEKVEMISEEDGSFFGFLPKEGEWNVLVESEDPDVFRRFPRTSVERLSPQEPARVDFTLPGTRFRGVVVDERGAEVSRAQVVVAPSPLEGLPSVQHTDEEGKFEFEGLEERLFEVTAESREGAEVLRSVPEPVSLSEGMSPEVRLVLRRELRIEGRVTTTDGFSIPGATIGVSPLSGRATLPLDGSVVITDGEGTFSVSVPGHADGVVLDVMAAGFALQQRVVQGALEEPVVITVEPSAGTVVLKLPEEPIHWSDWSQPIPVVFHGRGNLGFGANSLIRWAEMNGFRPSAPSGLLTFPLMPPGEYSVCMVAPRYVDLNTQPMIPSKRCTTGILSPWGELELEVPAWAAPSPAK